MMLSGFSQNGVRAHHLVADDRGVVHQDVEPALLALDLFEQGLRLFVVGMVDADGDARAARRRHQRPRFLRWCPPGTTGRRCSVRPVT